MSRVQVMITKSENDLVNLYLDEVGNLTHMNKRGLLNLAMRTGYRSLLNILNNPDEVVWHDRWVYLGKAKEIISIGVDMDLYEWSVDVHERFLRLMGFPISDSMFYRMGLIEGVQKLLEYYEIEVEG